MSSITPQNKEWILVERPSGLPVVTNWKLQDTPYPVTTKLSENQILIKLLYISVDPYIRNLIKVNPLNQPTVSGVVAEVIESTESGYAKGDIITQYLPWKLYQVITFESSKESTQIQSKNSKGDASSYISDPSKGIRKVDRSWGPISTAVGILGIPGQTAYFGLFEVCKFDSEKDKTVLVSGAAGAVGSLVVQLAKLKGAKVIATAGGKDKLDYVKSLGADAVIDYKEHKSAEAISKLFKEYAPNGIDCYFDNTGGHVTDAAFDNMNKFGRVTICGQISSYNDAKAPDHPNFLMKLIYKSITVRGLVVHDFISEYPRFYSEVSKLVQDGKVKNTETVFNGFEKVPEAFIGLFHGVNTGKAIVKVE